MKDSNETMDFSSTSAINHLLSRELGISSGTHKIEVQYRDATSGASFINVFWRKQNQFAAIYSNKSGTDFGDPVYFETTEEIKYDWKDQSPQKGVNQDSFKANWFGNFDIPLDGDWIFFASGVNGSVSLAVGAKTVTLPATSGGAAAVTLTKGSHTIEMTYQKTATGNSGAKLIWMPKNRFIARFFGYQGGSAVSAPEDMSSYLDLTKKIFSVPMFCPTTGTVNARCKYKTGKFEGAFEFAAGEYDFLRTGNNMRVWIDDVRISSSGYSELMKKIALTAGYHLIRIEYDHYTEANVNSEISYKRDPATLIKNGTFGGDILVRLRWEPSADQTNRFTASYTSSNLYQVFQRERISQPGLDYNLAKGTWPDYEFNSPSVFIKRMPPANCVWEGDWDFDSDPYLFTLLSDSNHTVKVFVDGATLMSGSNRIFTETIAMNKGKHRIRIEYTLKSDQSATDSSRIYVNWEKISRNTLYYRCFNTTSFTMADGSVPAYSVWGTGGESGGSISKAWTQSSPPACGTTSGGFSGEWIGVFDFTEAEYVIRKSNTYQSLIIDGATIAPNNTEGRLKLRKAPHTVRALTYGVVNTGTSRVEMNVSWELAQGHVSMPTRITGEPKNAL